MMTDKTESATTTNENPLFLGLVGNLQVSAVIHLGKIADPISGETKRDLPAAKASIDLLRMLRVKTQGNLSETESRLLDHAIFELELNYVEESGKEGREPDTEKTATEDARDEDSTEQPGQHPG
jgi:hypothetical protein